MNKIIEAFRCKYKECQFYSDKGAIYRNEPNQPASEPTTFRTNFQRQRDFCFEWLDPTKGAFKVWTEAELVSVATPRTGLRHSSDLRSALAEVAGISQGATSLIPMFLTSDNSLLDRIDWNVEQLNHPENSEPGNYYNLVGSVKNENDAKLYITEQYTLYKVELANTLSVEDQEALLQHAAKIAANHGQTLTLPEKRNRLTITQYCFDEVRIT
jgi:hypothetical protein